MPDARRSMGSVSCVMGCVGAGEIKFTISGEKEEYSRNELLPFAIYVPLSRVFETCELLTILVNTVELGRRIE